MTSGCVEEAVHAHSVSDGSGRGNARVAADPDGRSARYLRQKSASHCLGREPLAVAARQRCMTSNHRALGVTALFVGVLTAGCTSTGNGFIETAPTETPSSTPSSNAPSDTPPKGVTPSGKQFEVYTHCGVENTRIQGFWWHAEPPLYNKRRNGPPAGWGDPYQTGTLTMVSDDRAVFEALGRKVVFVPAPDNQPVRICD